MDQWEYAAPSIQECVLINYFTFAMYSWIYSVLELIAFRFVMNELSHLASYILTAAHVHV